MLISPELGARVISRGAQGDYIHPCHQGRRSDFPSGLVFNFGISSGKNDEICYFMKKVGASAPGLQFCHPCSPLLSQW